MLTIVGWLWRDPNCRTQYTVEHANVWARMLDRNITIPHRFLVFTDDMNDVFDPLIEKAPLWSEHHLLDNPRWQGDLPQCYVRLQAFSRAPEIMQLLGPRYVSIDFDCVVLGNLDTILGRKEPFLIYRRPKFEKKKDKYADPYNGSMWMMDTGALPQVWEDFQGARSVCSMPDEKAFYMTDQGWMLYKLGPKMPGWTMDDGVFMYSWLAQHGFDPILGDDGRYYVTSKGKERECKIVFFNGRAKPWTLMEWIGEAYR